MWSAGDANGTLGNGDIVFGRWDFLGGAIGRSRSYVGFLHAMVGNGEKSLGSCLFVFVEGAGSVDGVESGSQGRVWVVMLRRMDVSQMFEKGRVEQGVE